MANNIGEYVQILKDVNCLKILYYLEKFNPNVPVEELSQNLCIDEDSIKVCISKLIEARLVLNEETGGYSLTPFCRSAFRELLGKKDE